MKLNNILLFFGVLSVLFFRYDKVPLRPVPPLITQVMAKEEPLWEWTGAPPYKNERLAYYQNLLIQKGIINQDHLRNLTAQIIQENGSLNEFSIGDNGCSWGIPQRNVCNFGYTAKEFSNKYPIWKDWRFQLQWMADEAKKHYDLYNGDIFRAVVAHNSPSAAKKNKDACHITPCYWQRNLQLTYLLSK